MAEEAKWYVAHTYSGYENKVKEDLEKTVENRGLQDMILEISYPTEEVVEMKDGKRKVVTRKMLPGYVMIKMIMNDKTWYVVRNTRGVTGFVGPDSKPVPLTPEEQEELRKKEERKDRLHQNYLRRKANGKQKEWEERYNAKRKAQVEAAKAAIRAEDIEKGIFIPASQLPRQEPRKATLPASAAV